MHDINKVTGQLELVLRGADGAIKRMVVVKNLVVDAGKNHIASRLKDTSQAAMGWIAVGTGVTAAAAGDTALQTELTRVAVGSVTVAANQTIYTATLPAGVGTGALTEAGIFNAGIGGTMLARTVFPVQNKQGGDSLSLTWTITQG